ncbi:unnamed protein product [Bemisia tabaci]|uniref:NADH dehydrogenase [ubiquinone] 1 alpha subcomplex subunit 5 n=1 Tax=Bemisia tabaci TaxID=7038 RepID=A0A9P0EXS6_BEMTA|nr:PREDICTED: NADH dehydrogenase [ubiquinone] 1 alpha subcomplex subunit 5 [Bemisia tabaci]CAH0383625.1 unnamed protein product [Bemisia tabaci]
MSSYKYLKQTTNLTGLKVAINPHYSLKLLYGKILKTLDKMPPNAAYPKYTREIIEKRHAIVQSTERVEDIEAKIGCGQAEELIVQAENELHLARNMLAWRPWEPLLSEPPPNQWTWPPTK